MNNASGYREMAKEARRRAANASLDGCVRTARLWLDKSDRYEVLALRVEKPGADEGQDPRTAALARAAAAAAVMGEWARVYPRDPRLREAAAVILDIAAGTADQEHIDAAMRSVRAAMGLALVAGKRAGITGGTNIPYHVAKVVYRAISGHDDKMNKHIRKVQKLVERRDAALADCETYRCVDGFNWARQGDDNKREATT